MKLIDWLVTAAGIFAFFFLLGWVENRIEIHPDNAPARTECK